jgi:prepilin-type N-terminal cleavage/methylation domain-containing protein
MAWTATDLGQGFALDTVAGLPSPFLAPLLLVSLRGDYREYLFMSPLRMHSLSSFSCLVCRLSVSATHFLCKRTYQGQRRSFHRSGFTLVEMVVAIAIGGIMTAIAVPSFSDMREGYRLRAATYEVFAALQRARSDAVKKNNNYQFSLVNQTTFRIHDDTDNDGTVDAGETVVDKHVTDVASGTQVYFWSPPFNFTPDGTIAGGGTGGNWVAIVNSQWEWKWVQISRTGRITVF